MTIRRPAKLLPTQSKCSTRENVEAILDGTSWLGQQLVPFLEGIGIDMANGSDPAAVADGFHERGETLVQMADIRG
jgi:hypothetical protein